MCEFSLLVGGCLAEQTLKRGDEFRPDGLQFVHVVQSKPPETFLSSVGEFNEYLTSIVCGPDTNQHASIREPIDESDDAVMLELHSFRQNTDSGAHFVRQTFNGQKQLVLLRFQSFFARGGLAKSEKAPDLVAKLGHRLEVRWV